MDAGVNQDKEDNREKAPPQEELLDRYRYLASILENMLDPVIVANPDGTIRTVNPATLKLLGYTEKEIIGRPVGAIFAGDFFSGAGLARLVCEGTARNVNVTLRTKSGERIPVIFNGSAIREKDGRLTAVVGVARDMREQLRAEEALKRRATQLQALSEVGQEIASLLELDPLLDRIVNLIHAAFGYPYVTLLLVDPITNELMFKAGAGYELEPAKAARLKVGGEGICGWVAGSGKPLLANDVSQEPRYYPLKVPSNTQAELGVPIKVRGQVIGVLDAQSPQLGAFDEEDLLTLQALADQVGVAIENARVYQQLQEAVARTTRLYELSVGLGERRGLKETLNLVVQKVLAATGAHSAMINLMDEEGNLKFRTGLGSNGEPLEDEPLPRPVGTTASICRTGQPLVVSGVGKEGALIHPSLQKRGIKAFIGLPLKTEGRSIGALFIRYKQPHQFREDEVRALSLFASQAAVTIENARLFEETERLRTFNESIVNGVAEAILIENAEGILTFVNPAAEELTGYTRDELIGHHWRLLIPEEQIEKVQKETEKRPHGIKSRYETTLLSKEGKRVPVIVSARPLFTAGKFVGVLSALIDITERVRAEEALRNRFVKLAETVAQIFTLRDPYVGTHQRRTAKLARMVGERMGLEEERLEALYIGSLLHDIGKVAIPEGILRKPGKLTPEEWDLVRTHPQRGYEILKDTDLPRSVAEMALHHHERLDGSGYPNGLKGDELSLEVRILAVCNVVDAMSAPRPWRPARTKQEIIEELKNGAGVKYDPDVVEVLLEMIEDGELVLADKTPHEQ